MDLLESFGPYFSALAGIASGPYLWQQKLFRHFVAGNPPRQLCLPTGLGKTSVMPVWLLALAAAPDRVPRRLIWVVNRRVVVDQATNEAEKTAGRFKNDVELEALRKALGDTVAVSTLRGQRADNQLWSHNPSRPAIVVGTVDMIGSRLLFSGYGDGKWGRAQHAGLLGQDCLIVNDEAHLTPAFAKLLRGVSDRLEARSIKPFWSMSVSATLDNDEIFPESLDADLAGSAEFSKRVSASKRLSLHAVEKKQIESTIVELATKKVHDRTLVFCTSPKLAASIRERIQKKVTDPNRVLLLTGTLRGFERDKLAENPVFKEFEASKIPEHACWMIATSAGEVGVNISADRLITEMESAEHLIQRFGRLNRFGETDGEAHLVYSQPSDKEPARKATINWLTTLPCNEKGIDVSAQTLFCHRPPGNAISNPPLTAPLSDWLIDVWSQTSLGRCLARPDVEAWLHGKPEKETPETEVAWRWDVEYLTRDGVDKAEIKQALRRYPVRPRERLRDATYRVYETISKLEGSIRVVLVASDSTIKISTLSDIKADELRYSLVLLPEKCGSIRDGFFEAGAPAEEMQYDVADEGEERSRALARDPNLRILCTVDVPASENGDPDEEPIKIYYNTKRKGGRAPGQEIALEAHLDDVAKIARGLGENLHLPSDIVRSLERAGKIHDRGKAAKIWQEAMNGDPQNPIAKSASPGRPALLSGFRHELGSLLRATDDDAQDDLVLHLVAAHHGWARPHFLPRCYDRDSLAESENAAFESTRRFARLTEKYGHWGLAYLEAIFKAADVVASVDAGIAPEEAQATNA